jgi:hypothetical protein
MGVLMPIVTNQGSYTATASTLTTDTAQARA